MKYFAVPFAVILVSVQASSQLHAADQVFFGNLHSHTSYSDGSGTPSQAYAQARDVAKLDFLAITEHNHRLCEEGASSDRADGIMIAKSPELYTGPGSSALIPSASSFNKDGQFVALYGQEFSSISKGNHINVFEINDVIDDQTVPNGRFDSLVTWLQTHKDSTGQDAMIQFNHAILLDHYAIQYGADDFGGQAGWIAKMSPNVCLFEVLNGPGLSKTSAPRSAEISDADFDRYLLLGFRLSPTGDQDNHYMTWGTLTETRTGVITDELTKAKILAALRARHTYATEDKNLRLIFKVNDHLCGDVIPAPAVGTELQITYTIQDDDEPDAAYSIEVRSGMVGGSAVNSLETISTAGNNAAPKTIADIAYSGGAQFIYFKIVQSSESGTPDRAWTAPVWFDATTGGPTTEDSSQFVASRNSGVYHLSPDCRSAKAIKAANRITGAAAKEGRTPHQGCPVQ